MKERCITLHEMRCCIPLYLLICVSSFLENELLNVLPLINGRVSPELSKPKRNGLKD